MGNRFIKGLIHSIFIVGLIVGSYSWKPWQITAVYADGGPNDGNGNDGDIPNEVKHILARLANSSQVLSGTDLQNMSRLQNLKYYDVGEIVWDRFEHEVRNLNNPGRYEHSPGFEDIVEEIFKVAPSFTTQEHRNQLVCCLRVANEQVAYLKAIAIKGPQSQMNKFLQFEDFMDNLQNRLKDLIQNSPTEELKRLNDPLHIKNVSKVATSSNGGSENKVLTREEVEKIEEGMNKHVVGQPFAIKAFVNLLYETYTYGYGREKPKKLFLSGMPGTGKDTLVKEFINEIYNRRDAYVDHVFEAPIAKHSADLWSMQGSTTGHVGSENLARMVVWLVKHSAGKYKIVKPESPQDQFAPHVVENPNWKPGMVLPGYFAPEESVVYVNEVDKWSKNNINAVWLRAMENGYFQINNPGKGLDRIFVPVNIVFASNDLIPAIAARDRSGKRVGAALNLEQLNENVIKIENDPSIFRNQLLAASSLKSDMSTELSVGYSEEFINRLYDQELVPLRVLGPEALKKILNLNLEPLRERLKNSRGAYAGLEIEWDNKLVDFLHDYQRNPEEGARLMQARVTQLVENTIMKMIKEQKINPKDLPAKVLIDVEKNADGTTDLVLKRSDNQAQILAQTLIDSTVSEKKNAPLSDQEFAHLATLPQRLAKHVYGIEPILEKIGKAIALSKDAETRKRDGVQEHKKAEVFFLLGFSSTGKTETGKAVARELFPEGEAARVTIDFNNVRSVQDLRDLILGTTHGERAIPSKFMQEYDRLNGRVVFMFEEVANAPLDILKGLYDILDESVVTGFADKKPRSMSKVIILGTGNAGEEWYKNIPRNLPFDMQMATMRQIYDQAMENLDFQRIMLEKYFSEAFINRVGISRFLFYPPFNHESIRKISIGRVQKAIDELKPKEGERGWNVGFKDQQDYMKFIEAVENEGFVLREQGRSIVNYVNEEVTGKIKWELRSAGVADGARVIVVPKLDTDKESVNFDLIVEGREKSIPLALKKRPKIEDTIQKTDDVALTSFHEAGHNFLMKTLLGDKFKPTRVSRIPGVIMEGASPLVYEGIAVSEKIENLQYNREAILEMIAVKLGGDVAETLVTKGGRRHAGISDDIARATALARKAVMEWGLSDVWGRRSVRESELASLTDAEKKTINDEVDKFLRDGRALAEAIISEKGNFEVFKALGLEIFKYGDLQASQIEAFYKQHQDKVNYPSNIESVIEAGKKASMVSVTSPENNGLFVKRNHNIEFVDGITLPKDYADLNKILAEKKKQAVEKVGLPSDVSIFSNFKNVVSSVHGSTQGLLCSRLFM